MEVMATETRSYPRGKARLFLAVSAKAEALAYLEATTPYFWHLGQKWVPRPATTIFLMGVPQVVQGSPPRP